MAQLSSVIGSILRDIITAQHEANLYSLSLSDSYGKDGKVRYFTLPNVVVTDMELDLKYGIVSTTGNQEQQNLKFAKFRQFLKEVCFEAAKAAITSIVSTVLSSDIRRNEEDKLFFLHLKQQEDLNKKFRIFLMHNMRSAFDYSLRDALDFKTGKVQTDVVTVKLMHVVEKKFLGDQDLNDLFEGPDGLKLKKEAEDAARKALTDLVQTLSAGQSFKRIKNLPQLDVAVTAEELEKLPEEAINSFKLKFSPTNCNIAEFENEKMDDFDME